MCMLRKELLLRTTPSFWITRSGGAILCHNKGNIGLKRLRDIQSIVESQHRLVVEKWIAKFGEISYFC